MKYLSRNFSGFRHTLLSGLWWIGCFWLLFAASTHAVEALASTFLMPADTRTINRVAMGPYTEVWYDTARSANIEAVRSPPVQSAFKPAGGIVNVPANGTAVWLKLRLHQMGYFNDWILSTRSQGIREVSFYGPYSITGHALAEPVVTGAITPYATRALGYEAPSMRVQLDYPDEYEIYVRLASEVDKWVEFHLSDEVSFFQTDQTLRLFDGVCYGVLLGLLIYNLALRLVFPYSSFALYVLAGLSGLLSVASFNGHLARYVFFDFPVLGYRLNTLFPAMWIALAALFAWNFMDLRRRWPKAHWVVLAITAAGLISAIAAGCGFVGWSHRLNEIGSFTGTIIITVFTLLAIRQGFRPARLYLLGQMALFSGTVTAVAFNWGIPLHALLASKAIQVGVAVEYLLFAAALTSNIQQLERERRKLQDEKAVLAIASETDPLTGIANRAGLAKAGQALLSEADVGRVFIYIDLDRFKPINDGYGHAAGDVTLTEVGKRLRMFLRAGDTVARVGGDEFVIMLANLPSREQLRKLCLRILDDLKHPIPFGEHQLQIGASLGVAVSPADASTLEGLAKCADQAMYDVKTHGRDGIRFFDELGTTPKA